MEGKHQINLLVVDQNKRRTTTFFRLGQILLLETQSENLDDSDSEMNPDPNKYVDRYTLRYFYDILNVKLTYGTDFQSFYDLLKVVSEDMSQLNESQDDFVIVDVLDIFCENFLKGFNKLILELGFDVVSDEICE